MPKKVVPKEQFERAQLQRTLRSFEVTPVEIEAVEAAPPPSSPSNDSAVLRRRSLRSVTGGGGFGGSNVPQFDKTTGKLRRKKPLE